MGDKVFVTMTLSKKDWENIYDEFRNIGNINIDEENVIEEGIVKVEFENYWSDMFTSLRWVASRGITTIGWLEDSGNEPSQIFCTISRRCNFLESVYEQPAIQVQEGKINGDLRNARVFMERFDKARTIVWKK